MLDGPPTPPEVAKVPELAVLSILDFALEASLRALVATWPEIGGEDDGDIEDAQARCALCIVEVGWTLGRLLAQYRALARAPRPTAPSEQDGEIP